MISVINHLSVVEMVCHWNRKSSDCNFSFKVPRWSNFYLLIFRCMLVISSSKNVKQGCKLKLTYLYACSIMYIRHHLQYEKGTPKVAGNAVNIGEVWNPVCCHGNKTVKLKLCSTFSRILLQRIKHFWYKVTEISFFMIFYQNLVECMMSSLG